MHRSKRNYRVSRWPRQRSDQLFYTFAKNRMPPAGRDFRKRDENKRAVMHARVRKRGWTLFNAGAKIKNIEIERPRRITRGTSATERGFRCMQKRKKIYRRKARSYLRYRIDEHGIHRIGPCGTKVEPRDCLDRNTGSAEFRERSPQSLRRRANAGRKVPTERDKGRFGAHFIPVTPCTAVQNT